MKNTTTPGPWRVDSRKHGVFIMSGGYCIASTADNRTSSDCRNNELANNNAHLIAAAPALLEACKWAFVQLNGQKKGYVVGTDLLHKEDTIAELKSAIAKAEGAI